MFSESDDPVTGHVALPEGKAYDVKLSRDSDGKFKLEQGPAQGRRSLADHQRDRRVSRRAASWRRFA